jgi:alpha-beta hydrolase superfamily lysophospholipase
MAESGSTTPFPAVEGRACVRLAAPGEPALVVQTQGDPRSPRHVLYVHGATFGCELSVFRRFGEAPDARSWADALVDAGFAVHGFDFAGYGRSDRYPPAPGRIVGRMDEAGRQLARVVAHLRRVHARARLGLIAHSWGGTVAAGSVASGGVRADALALFAPVVRRAGGAIAPAPGPAPFTDISLLAQYRRFVGDVPRGQPQVLDEAEFEAWGRDWLATDPASAARRPAAVRTPLGPAADVDALWSGEPLVAASRIECPTLVVRGEWDSVCDDADAASFLAECGAADRRDVVLARGTHLMHLERTRGALHEAVGRFLRQAVG